MKRPRTIIKELKNSQDVEVKNVYQNRSIKSWYYYFSITGHINNKYFSVYLFKNRSNKIEVFEVSCRTECKNKLLKILYKIEPKLKGLKI